MQFDNPNPNDYGSTHDDTLRYRRDMGALRPGAGWTPPPPLSLPNITTKQSSSIARPGTPPLSLPNITTKQSASISRPGAPKIDMTVVENSKLPTNPAFFQQLSIVVQGIPKYSYPVAQTWKTFWVAHGHVELRKFDVDQASAALDKAKKEFAWWDTYYMKRKDPGPFNKLRPEVYVEEIVRLYPAITAYPLFAAMYRTFAKQYRDPKFTDFGVEKMPLVNSSSEGSVYTSADADGNVGVDFPDNGFPIPMLKIQHAKDQVAKTVQKIKKDRQDWAYVKAPADALAMEDTLINDMDRMRLDFEKCAARFSMAWKSAQDEVALWTQNLAEAQSALDDAMSESAAAQMSLAIEAAKICPKEWLLQDYLDAMAGGGEALLVQTQSFMVMCDVVGQGEAARVLSKEAADMALAIAVPVDQEAGKLKASVLDQAQGTGAGTTGPEEVPEVEWPSQEFSNLSKLLQQKQLEKYVIPRFEKKAKEAASKDQIAYTEALLTLADARLERDEIVAETARQCLIIDYRIDRCKLLEAVAQTLKDKAIDLTEKVKARAAMDKVQLDAETIKGLDDAKTYAGTVQTVIDAGKQKLADAAYLNGLIIKTAQLGGFLPKFHEDKPKGLPPPDPILRPKGPPEPPPPPPGDSSGSSTPFLALALLAAAALFRK